ncbi:MAG: 2-keto-4-pentenoate hydratase/2-oxohepta-3-ene-1,7-dioic acid hydratase in catechol pathway [Candidatus Azotimanducaceae bacterium]|jgi:2-keto-4-pentenoate hydratase/2-oxohepta-3-ene-1,7-dioic acid hydratase in catechol pathway
MIESISAKEPLFAGDIHCPGTPHGLGIVTGRYLSAGDVVALQIRDWPVLRNQIA